MNHTTYSLIENKNKIFDEQNKNIRNKIEFFFLKKKDKNINPKKISNNKKGLESPKSIWQI